VTNGHPTWFGYNDMFSDVSVEHTAFIFKPMGTKVMAYDILYYYGYLSTFRYNLLLSLGYKSRRF
jgi:hypothetical protein